MVMAFSTSRITQLIRDDDKRNGWHMHSFRDVHMHERAKRGNAMPLISFHTASIHYQLFVADRCVAMTVVVTI